MIYIIGYMISLVVILSYNNKYLAQAEE